MLYTVTSYIIFLFRSKNQHGVHSPFVYNLLTQGLYIPLKPNKIKILKNLYRHEELPISYKNTTCLLKLLYYFDVEHLHTSILYGGENLKIAAAKSDLKVYDFTSSEEDIRFLFLSCDEIISNSYKYNDIFSIQNKDVTIFLADIHKTKKHYEVWKRMSAHKKVSVSIDTFFFGLLFFRTEQTKEHFVLRV